MVFAYPRITKYHMDHFTNVFKQECSKRGSNYVSVFGSKFYWRLTTIFDLEYWCVVLVIEAKKLKLCTKLVWDEIQLFKSKILWPSLVFVTSLGPVRTWRQRCAFFGHHVWAVTLMTMQPISDDMVSTSKICVIVAKCERALISDYFCTEILKSYLSLIMISGLCNSCKTDKLFFLFQN